MLYVEEVMRVYRDGMEDMGHWLTDLGFLIDMAVQGNGYGGYLHARQTYSHVEYVDVRFVNTYITVCVFHSSCCSRCLCGCEYSFHVHKVIDYRYLGVYTCFAPRPQPYLRIYIRLHRPPYENCYSPSVLRVGPLYNDHTLS